MKLPRINPHRLARAAAYVIGEAASSPTGDNANALDAKVYSAKQAYWIMAMNEATMIWYKRLED